MNKFHLLPTHCFFFFFLSRSCVYRNSVHAPIISRRGRQSVRGIFRLTDFHLQSGDVTFVWGNEIALQQTVGYIILSPPHILLSSSPPPSSSPFISGFFSHCSSARETQKKPVSQDQLVTSRELWSGEGAEETKATAMLASWRGDKVTWSSFQAINVTSSPCPGKVELTAEWCPARTGRERESSQKSSGSLWCDTLPFPPLHFLLLSLSSQMFSFSLPTLSLSFCLFLNSISALSPEISPPPPPSLS